MTPFMIRVAEAVGMDFEAEEWPVPATRPSVATPVNEGTDRHVNLRAYAEQLVCEANAVLDHADDHMSLVDEFGGEELAFLIRYHGRAVRVSTRYLGGAAYGQLVGDGIPHEEPRELEGPQAIPDLLMMLLLESSLTRHPR